MLAFKNSIACMYGDKGRKWIEDLPRFVSDFSRRWNLLDLKPFNNFSYNYVLSGFQENKPIVLKLGLDTENLKREAKALEVFKGFGAVEVIEQADGVLLLEGVIPGCSLKQLFPDRDEEAIIIACNVIDKLHYAPKETFHDFPTIKNWLVSLDKSCEMFEEHLLKARILRDELLVTMEMPILLHGDLHHENILAHGNEWKVIDPKGVVGEFAYEVGCFIRNPLDFPNQPDCLGILKNRIGTFSQYLNLDPQRITKWCYVQTMLSIVWACEDCLDYEDALRGLFCFEKLLD